MTIDNILDRLADGLGGIERLQQLRSIKVSGSLQVGDLVGTVVAITEIGTYRHYRSIDLSIHRHRQGFDGQVIWSDTNGQMSIQADPDEIVDAITSEKFNNYDYLVNRSKYSFSLVEMEQVIALDIVSLECQNELVGRKRFILDTDGDYIVASEGYSDGEFELVEFKNYEKVSGLMLPTMQVAHDREGQAAIIMLDCIEVDGLIDDDGFSIPIVDQNNYRLLSSEGILPIPFRMPLDHIFIDVEIAKMKFEFVVDTGADMTVIADDVVSQLDLATYGVIQGQGVSGQQELTFVRLPDIIVGHVELVDLPVVATDSNSIRSFRPTLSGILGLDFLNRFIVKLDYSRKEMTLFEREGFTCEHEVCLSLDRNYVEMMIDGYSGKFKIDTGSDRITLHSWFVKRCGFVTGDDVPSSTRISGLGGEPLTEYRIIGQEVSLGNFTIAAPPLCLSTMEVGAFANEAVAGNVGNNFWRRFILHFDLMQNRLFVATNENFDEAWRVQKFGADFKTYEGRHFVDTVTTRSPASETGVEVGDELLLIDGNDALSYSREDIVLRFCEPSGTICTLRFGKQDGRRIDIDIELRDYMAKYIDPDKPGNAGFSL